jgi:hypothetical protein
MHNIEHFVKIIKKECHKYIKKHLQLHNKEQ